MKHFIMDSIYIALWHNTVSYVEGLANFNFKSHNGQIYLVILGGKNRIMNSLFLDLLASVWSFSRHGTIWQEVGYI